VVARARLGLRVAAAAVAASGRACDACAMPTQLWIEGPESVLLHAAECVDEQRSEGVSRWTAEDGRPDRIGDYHAMDKLVIDPERAGGLDFFRVAHYSIALIVSERLKRAMEDAKLLGPRFEPVT
jgi:uncharacterized protein DUF1629